MAEIVAPRPASTILLLRDATARKANPEATIQIAATIEDAVAVGHRLATSQKRKIYVAGGLFLAIEYATVARGGHAEDLKFF